VSLSLRALALLLLAAVLGFSQERPATLAIQVTADSLPVNNATVTVNGTAVTTDAQGIARANASVGKIEVSVKKEGFLPATTSLTIDDPAREWQAQFELQPERHEDEEITVFATRTDKRLQDVPTRVEVLGREEIEEKMLMTPGDITMMLNEMGGMRVQTTSPALGAASVRIQGMRGRYTRFLSDGLPLFGQQGGGLGLLQIPPMDLGQVEVIKGAASALYGAGAMGGVVNLIARRPTEEPINEVLLNRSTLGGTDASVFLASKLTEHWGATLITGGHFQEDQDLDRDRWADLAGYSRGVVRPRFFWDNGSGETAFVTGGITYENRQGGTLASDVLPQTGAPYVEALDTRRFDFGGTFQSVVREKYVLTARLAASSQRHNHRFGEVLERDRHDMLFGELSARGSNGRHTWVLGTAVERDAYRPRDVPQFGYVYLTPGIFAQDDVDITSWFSLSASARVDFQNQYGTFFSPRLAALFRWEGWTSRVSFGQGFFAPTPLTEDTEATGLTRLSIPLPLVPERGRSVSLDITRTLGPASFTATLFGSRINDPIEVLREERYELVNLAEPTTNVGTELLGTYRKAPFTITGSYTYVHSRELHRGSRVDVSLTPRHSAGLVGMWEKEGEGRIGLECYYTGRQRLEENPYRSESNPYVIFGALAERKVGPVRLFINAENLTNVRQTRWDSLLRPGRAVDGRWTVDAWAPLDGRVFNGGIRLQF
jgi:outer membrane receptor for ferrienterochelin and colicins